MKDNNKSKLQLEIITPLKPAFKGEVNSVTIPGTNGEFQVFPLHAPLISSIEPGRLIIDIDGTKSKYFISFGTVEIEDDRILIITDAFEESSVIDIDRAKKAAERAKERLKPENRNKFDIDRAESALIRSIARQKVSANN